MLPLVLLPLQEVGVHARPCRKRKQKLLSVTVAAAMRASRIQGLHPGPRRRHGAWRRLVAICSTSVLVSPGSAADDGSASWGAAATCTAAPAPCGWSVEQAQRRPVWLGCPNGPCQLYPSFICDGCNNGLHPLSLPVNGIQFLPLPAVAPTASKTWGPFPSQPVSGLNGFFFNWVSLAAQDPPPCKSP